MGCDEKSWGVMAYSPSVLEGHSLRVLSTMTTWVVTHIRLLS